VIRVASGAVLVAIAVAVVWFVPPFVFQSVAVVVAALALWELSGLVRAGALRITPGLGAVAVVALGTVYIVLPIAALVAMRLDIRSGGPGAVFLVMLTVMVSDTAQYYAGRAFGRRRLAPTISPKKTVEGAVGGFVFGTAAFAIVGAWWAPQLPVAARLGLGPIIVALGIAGDLFESMLKRRAGVKDSSSIIPGHGGVLDRIDALLFVAPVYYVVLKYA
jgi:phosphatidate cytidylyltransferase